jgi:phospholipid/cholesterol/gamma-HCH transport system substrate-binding protein
MSRVSRIGKRRGPERGALVRFVAFAAVLGGNEKQLGRIIRNLARFVETARLNIDQLEQMVRDLPLTLRELFLSANRGHYFRANALCINVVHGPCPFPMMLPT